jgi:hypothetical protein
MQKNQKYQYFVWYYCATLYNCPSRKKEIETSLGKIIIWLYEK